MVKSDFKNKKVTIMGLGISGGGVGAAEFFAKAGARVLVTDLKTRGKLRESLGRLKGLSIRYVLGRHRKEDFENADLIIKNPGVPNESKFLALAKKSGVPIETDVGIFFDLCPAPVVGVTGTKGKSTTAFLIHQILKRKYKNAVLGGNIGKSVLEVLPKIKKGGPASPTSQGGPVILELSSFQLEALTEKKLSPHIAVITNIFPDHLNRYSSFAQYAKAKTNIFRFQKPEDFLIIPEDNRLLEKLTKNARSKKIYFSKIVAKSIPFLSLAHNAANLAAAIEIAKLFKISRKEILSLIPRLKLLPHRLEKVGEIGGVAYINDSGATNPGAGIEAIKAARSLFKNGRLILIAGGEDKNLDYSVFAGEILKNADFLILLPGSATEKMKVEFQKHLARTKNLKLKAVIDAPDMKQAVIHARRLAQKRDAVLLSPAAASFNLFQNEFDRGEQFIKALRSLR
ncbi:MAG: UDP-N-acetylmuramoylalanine-D-glutamate ligase [Candidatus Azambacteria bacterium GW2011_GWB2_46_37]|uniref:UDP-N-acetylmuramoylalanine--D-glutamate ligase n=4 Tax=Candidatus Azamiibacteriota TaxID=1752741 RepID=A0A0G1Q326_9BACT|nr:MAG: UDP-N-acetylmuramoylalanine-D-glutamate ligase [Candidatus Azambacteria bacterium GW2011_GWB2_46_37]HAM95456.1 UDP-N-acetylmuramoyl-L-alanine--D-glutamate ligase [Candidatus Azambacteria bacterium]HBA52358.1 UDP-N-acetylmuramoyl-L-alanine--D-glutamate ligase [Candidatus Azambacteria bacterium]